MPLYTVFFEPLFFKIKAFYHGFYELSLKRNKNNMKSPYFEKKTFCFVVGHASWLIMEQSCKRSIVTDINSIPIFFFFSHQIHQLKSLLFYSIIEYAIFFSFFAFVLMFFIRLFFKSY